MSDRPPVLVLGNDLSPSAVKTARNICLSLGRLGLRAVGRDTRLIRWAAREVEREDASRREAYETGVVSKWNKFIFDYGFDTIISLDLNWLISVQLFVDDAQVKQIHSFWFDNVRTHIDSMTTFPLGASSIQAIIGKPKMSHHCCLPGQAEALQDLGVEKIFPAKPSVLPELPSGTGAEGKYWDDRLKAVLT